MSCAGNVHGGVDAPDEVQGDRREVMARHIDQNGQVKLIFKDNSGAVITEEEHYKALKEQGIEPVVLVAKSPVHAKISQFLAASVSVLEIADLINEIRRNPPNDMKRSGTTPTVPEIADYFVKYLDIQKGFSARNINSYLRIANLDQELRMKVKDVFVLNRAINILFKTPQAEQASEDLASPAEASGALNPEITDAGDVYGKRTEVQRLNNEVADPDATMDLLADVMLELRKFDRSQLTQERKEFISAYIETLQRLIM